MASLSQTVPPDDEPVTLAAAKRQVQRDPDFADDDLLIKDLIASARDLIERFSGRQLLTATYELTLDAFPCGWDAIDIPRPPLVEVASIEYVDAAGVTQTWDDANYLVDAPSGPTADRGRIALAYGQIWPITRCQMNAVTITYTAGYGDDDELVPAGLKRAVLMLLSHWYSNRDAVDIGIGSTVTELPLGVAALVAPYKTRGIKALA